MKILINGVRTRSGGGVSHLKNTLPFFINDTEVDVYLLAPTDTLSHLDLPSSKFKIVKLPSFCQSSSFLSMLWEFFFFRRTCVSHGIDVVLNLDATSVHNFSPVVTMSRDMLSFESGVSRRFGFSLARFRIWLIGKLQIAALERSDKVIFLTNYARSIIEKKCNKLRRVEIIPHGVSESFFNFSNRNLTTSGALNFVYVSNLLPYKNHLVLCKAFSRVLSNHPGSTLSFTVDKNKFFSEYGDELRGVDLSGILFSGVIPNNKLPEYLTKFDVFVFASSCENMPNTLLEGMASGMPVLCSNRGPMPEVLGDSGIYFDPSSVDSAYLGFNSIITNPDYAASLAKLSMSRASLFTWKYSSSTLLCAIKSLI